MALVGVKHRVTRCYGNEVTVKKPVFQLTAVTSKLQGVRPNPLAIRKFMISGSCKNLFCCNRMSVCKGTKARRYPSFERKKLHNCCCETTYETKLVTQVSCLCTKKHVTNCCGDGEIDKKNFFGLKICIWVKTEKTLAISALP